MCAALGITENRLSPTVAAARALSDLIDTARTLLPIARQRRRRNIEHRLNVIIGQLDATRTRLVQDGEEYITTAWAFVDAGRSAIATYKLVLS